MVISVENTCFAVLLCCAVCVCVVREKKDSLIASIVYFVVLVPLSLSVAGELSCPMAVITLS